VPVKKSVDFETKRLFSVCFLHRFIIVRSIYSSHWFAAGNEVHECYFYQYLKCVYQVLTTLFSDFTKVSAQVLILSNWHQ